MKIKASMVITSEGRPVSRLDYAKRKEFACAGFGGDYVSPALIRSSDKVATKSLGKDAARRKNRPAETINLSIGIIPM
jgi:hypothetical protein